MVNGDYYCTMIATIVPVQKVANAVLAEELRRINTITCDSKLVKLIVKKQLTEHIEENNIGSAKNFFWKMLKKKLLNIFSNFCFYLKVQSFRLIMENNFIQMAALLKSFKFLSTLSIVCSYISPMASRILSFKASTVSGL